MLERSDLDRSVFLKMAPPIVNPLRFTPLRSLWLRSPVILKTILSLILRWFLNSSTLPFLSNSKRGSLLHLSLLLSILLHGDKPSNLLFGKCSLHSFLRTPIIYHLIRNQILYFHIL